MSKAAELAKWGEVSTNGQVSGRYIYRLGRRYD
jgi:hypothetical protein